MYIFKRKFILLFIEYLKFHYCLEGLMNREIKTIILLYITVIIISYMVSVYFVEKGLLFFFFLFSTLTLFFYMVFVMLKNRKTIKKLQLKIKQKEAKVDRINSNFEKQLIQKLEHTVLKCEESKLISLKEMIKNISHQWRQPLCAISLSTSSIQLELVKQNNKDTKELKEYCILINSYVEYLSQTLNLLDSSLFMKSVKSVFRIEHLINEFLEILKIQMKIVDINIEYIIEKDFSIYSYKKELLQVLLNVVNNSKDIFEQRKITTKYILIEIFQTDNEFIIDIKDNAGGIDEKIIDRVFEPYFTTKHQSQGTGLGLYSAYLTISKKLGGTISVQNTQYISKNKEYKCANFIIKAPIK